MNSSGLEGMEAAAEYRSLKPRFEEFRNRLVEVLHAELTTRHVRLATLLQSRVKTWESCGTPYQVLRGLQRAECAPLAKLPPPRPSYGRSSAAVCRASISVTDCVRDGMLEVIAGDGLFAVLVVVPLTRLVPRRVAGDMFGLP